MKQVLILLCFIAITSCDYFNKKKVYTKDILEEEMQSINWNDVDEYPTFSSCDSVDNKKACFEDELRNRLNQKLSQQTIIVTEDVVDTVILKIHIDKNGLFSIKGIKSSALTQEQIPQLDSLLRHSFDSLPKIYPAIKRSQQVATEFSLPVLVHIN